MVVRELGATTRWSCQDHGEGMAVDGWATGHLAAVQQWHLGWAVINFDTPADLMLFLGATADGGDRDEHYLRMVHLVRLPRAVVAAKTAPLRRGGVMSRGPPGRGSQPATLDTASSSKGAGAGWRP